MQRALGTGTKKAEPLISCHHRDLKGYGNDSVQNGPLSGFGPLLRVRGLRPKCLRDEFAMRRPTKAAGVFVLRKFLDTNSIPGRYSGSIAA